MLHIAATLFFIASFVGAILFLVSLTRSHRSEIAAALRGELPPRYRRSAQVAGRPSTRQQVRVVRLIKVRRAA